MDLNKAIEKHAEWKVKFRSAISKQELLDAETVSKDNNCELGKWLHGDSKVKLSKFASHSDCIAKHAEFHREAGNVAKAINAKKYTEAESMLSAGSSYSTASNAVGVAVRRLKKEAGL
ncbi:MAG: CZB domain-containing protein [Methyloglobulus sp.]|nr:CZB domain-containing protein [Methyloglobulus sp.]